MNWTLKPTKEESKSYGDHKIGYPRIQVPCKYLSFADICYPCKSYAFGFLRGTVPNYRECKVDCMCYNKNMWI